MRNTYANPLKQMIVALSLCIFTCHCSDQPSGLHPRKEIRITCRINGKPWISDTSLAEKNLRLVLYQDKSLQLYGKAIAGRAGDKQTRSVISITIASVEAPGLYPLGTSPKNAGDFTSYESSPFSLYATDQSSTGYVHITSMDTVNRVVSGEFEFQATAMGASSHVVNVTDGHFTVPY